MLLQPWRGGFAVGEAPWYITATSGPNGSIIPSGLVQVADGALPAFTISPAPGYIVDDVLVDAGSVGAVTGYTFPAVGADHTIHATFRLPRPKPEHRSGL